MSTAGQCKVDPPTGVAGVAYTAWTTDTDAGLLPAATVSNGPVRRLIGAMVQALVSALLGAGIVGSATIAAGAASVTVSNSAITAGSIVVPVIQGSSADATLTAAVRVSVTAGSVTIYGNALATADVSVAYLVVT